MRVSVCICTRNRPDELERALRSLEESSYPIHEVIVSDDSTDNATSRRIRRSFPELKYMRGPRQGLAANRNHCLASVTGSHVLFMDDDVVLAKTFLWNILKTGQQAERTEKPPIVTGLENNRGKLVHPNEQSFLGFQSRVYRQGEPLRTIVINSTVFPVQLFDELKFDENLIYGYEEVDIATRAAGRGYPIVLAPGAINDHYPSAANRDYYEPHVEASRLYATFKRYRFTERKRVKAASFLAAASLHALLHGVKERKPGRAWRTIHHSYSMIARLRY
ncbi:glycosyltransferase family 2 protein [Cohnella fermenti]|uniref:Glycosyltransferase family 2 protein n=1 Tax=Cohnella fermenti TaxID=2565925 RepID=A0A4S4BL66_9BACL|nr:glycosyltransferase family 2 protein [Cohnella fermenti]THF74906.1 glycosyltransferase family 2 protein [Cohnella fermenti]